MPRLSKSRKLKSTKIFKSKYSLSTLIFPFQWDLEVINDWYIIALLQNRPRGQNHKQQQKMKAKTLTILLIFCHLCFSCSYDSEDDLIDVPSTSTGSSGQGSGINYIDNVQPIMQSSCVSCHSSPPVNGAPFALVNYNQVNQRANAILVSMQRQSGAPSAMPPSGRLPQTTINIIEEWIAIGKPEN